jgi:hypothetical protein
MVSPNELEAEASKDMSKTTIVRILVYGFLCAIIAFGIVEKFRHTRLASQYQQDKERLEIYLQKDKRFSNVRVYFIPTRPSVLILAPNDLAPSAKNDLDRLVATNFAPLLVPVHYKDEVP